MEVAGVVVVAVGSLNPRERPSVGLLVATLVVGAAVVVEAPNKNDDDVFKLTVCEAVDVLGVEGKLVCTAWEVEAVVVAGVEMPENISSFYVQNFASCNTTALKTVKPAKQNFQLGTTRDDRLGMTDSGVRRV